MEEMVIITNSVTTINQHLKNGWQVKLVVAQNISGTGFFVKSDFCFVLERKKE